MIDLVDEPWEALHRLCRAHDAKHLDILTGYIGKGAARALATLGVRARIVLGLESAEAALSSAQIDELRLLCAHHEVRWRSGLHAKLYVVARRAVLVGSANFTRAGFEHLDELAVATDDPATVARATDAFEARFAEATPVEPDRLQALPTTGPGDADGLDAGLGVAWEDRRSGFTRAAPEATGSTPDASAAAPPDESPDPDEGPDSDDASIALDFDRDDFMYMNVAEGRNRCWADCRRYGFLSAGQHAKWSTQLRRLRVDAPVYAYFKGHGYVGVGIVDGAPRMASEHVVASLGRKLFDLPLVQPGIKTNAGDPSYCEWVIPIRWYRTRAIHERVGYGLFSSQHVTCRLRDPLTLQRLRDAFERVPG